MDGSDRRGHARLSIAVAVDFESGHNFYSVRTRDISMGGLFVETDAAVPIGTKLAVDLKFMKTYLRVDCEVMWALTDGDTTIGVGLRFVDLRPAAQKSIERFMALREPLSFGESETLDDDDPPSSAQPPPLPGPPPRP
jgi:uncharacterized protein (TIGR02266 family)